MTPKKYFQRGINRFETRLDESGIPRIVAAHLTCGHRIAYKRVRPVGSKRSAMPCPQCGAGPRTPWEAQRENIRLERVIRNAAMSQELCAALADVLRLTIEACATCPITEDQRRIWRDIEVCARASGLRDHDQGDLHERGPRTLSRTQRDALVAMGGV